MATEKEEKSKTGSRSSDAAGEKDPKRFVRPVSPVRQLAAAAEPDSEWCERLETGLNDRLTARCNAKVFKQTVGACEAGAGANTPVDLVIVIDTSGSMTDEASDLSSAADAAIQAAAQSCPSDLRVVWLGIEGTWPATNFNQSYRDHLGLPDPDLVGTPGDQEDGAAAIVDLSDHFGWRAGASRAVFYLGDEALEGGDPQSANDVTAADAAIAAANAAGVTVFTYFGTAPAGNPTTASEYARVATETGGQAFSSPVANLGGFQAVLETVICNAGSEACRPAVLPDLTPCIELTWGDSAQDQIETDDVEVLCITVCNPYSNVTLEDFTLSLVVTAAGQQPVPVLPDGSASLSIRPDYLICFGDIGPCDPQNQDERSCVSREVTLVSRGAAAGSYEVHLGYCFEARFTRAIIGQKFLLDLVAS